MGVTLYIEIKTQNMSYKRNDFENIVKVDCQKLLKEAWSFAHINFFLDSPLFMYSFSVPVKFCIKSKFGTNPWTNLLGSILHNHQLNRFFFYFYFKKAIGTKHSIVLYLDMQVFDLHVIINTVLNLQALQAQRIQQQPYQIM